MDDPTRQLKEKITAARPVLESARGYAIWTKAPVALTDALQRALEALDTAEIIVAQEVERKENEAMKELFAMLKAFNDVKEKVGQTTERIGKAGAACDAVNAQLDAFFEAAGLDDETAENSTPEGEAAANGELGDGGNGDATESDQPLETL